MLLPHTGEHKLTYDKGTAEESFEWLALRDLADTVIREDPAWPLPPPQRSAPAHTRQSRVLNPAEAMAAALRAGHTPEALHRMVDEAVASLAAASAAHAAHPPVSAAAHGAVVQTAAHQPPAGAGFHSQGSFMADLMNEDAEPAAAAPTSLPAAVDVTSAPAGHMAGPPVSQPDAAVSTQHDDGGAAAPLSMQLSMSELLGEDDGPPVAAPQADALAASAPPASGQGVSEPRKPPHAAAVPSGTSAAPPLSVEASQAVVYDASEVHAFGSATEAAMQQRAADGKDVRLPDPLAVQDSGYEADIEAAVKGEAGGIEERKATDPNGVASGQPADPVIAAQALAEPDGLAALSNAGSPSNM